MLGGFLYFEVIALYFVMQSQEFKVVSAGAPCLEVGEECLWRDVCVGLSWVPEFLQPRSLDYGKDKLCGFAPRRLVGAAVGALGLVRRFCARADDGGSIVINCRVVGSNACWFVKLCAIACCVSCHTPNEADWYVGYLRFVVGDMEEESCQELPDSREFGV